MTAIQRFYIDCPWGQVHGRRLGGAGFPVVLLHPSPLSSAALMAQMQRLSETNRCFALDIPGYGGSDPLSPPAERLDDFAHALLEACSRLGLERFALYGAATGAQVALMMAKAAPHRIARLVLDACGHFDAADRAAWEEAYFPDLTPQEDGSHLMRIWSMAERQATRFPWIHEPCPDDPPRGAPLAVKCAMTLGFLQAGPDYARAYRLAFHAEDAASFVGLTVATTLIDWEGSILRRETRALIAKGLPDCVRVLRAGATLQDRLEAIAQGVAAL